VKGSIKRKENHLVKLRKELVELESYRVPPPNKLAPGEVAPPEEEIIAGVQPEAEQQLQGEQAPVAAFPVVVVARDEEAPPAAAAAAGTEASAVPQTLQVPQQVPSPLSTSSAAPQPGATPLVAPDITQSKAAISGAQEFYIPPPPPLPTSEQLASVSPKVLDSPADSKASTRSLASAAVDKISDKGLPPSAESEDTYKIPVVHI